MHLPEHIRRFGPAILFATETFESYNALIRDHSIHSNRQAPSRDIGLGFAYANRIRHLASGGKFKVGEFKKRSLAGEQESDGAKKQNEASAVSPEDFRCIGPDAFKFIQSNQQLRKYIGIPDIVSDHARGIVVLLLPFVLITFTSSGGLKRDKAGIRAWEETRSSKLISVAAARQAKLDAHSFIGFASCSIMSGDTCSLDSWVIVRRGKDMMNIGRVAEILQVLGSSSLFSKNPDYILVSLYETGPLAEVYRLPILVNSGLYAMIPFQVLTFLFNLSSLHI